MQYKTSASRRYGRATGERWYAFLWLMHPQMMLTTVRNVTRDTPTLLPPRQNAKNGPIVESRANDGIFCLLSFWSFLRKKEKKREEKISIMRYEIYLRSCLLFEQSFCPPPISRLTFFSESEPKQIISLVERSVEKRFVPSTIQSCHTLRH